MTDHADKRTYCRFSVPDGTGRYMMMIDGQPTDYSEAYGLMNVSKGGLAIECGEPIPVGAKMKMQIMILGEEPLELYGDARWQTAAADGAGNTVGIQFYPFDNRPGYNSYESYVALEQLEAKYGQGEQQYASYT